jgi:hypothetical protein
LDALLQTQSAASMAATAAFEAIAAMLALGSVGFQRGPDARGELLIWLETAVIDRLTTMHGPGESYAIWLVRLVRAGQRPSAKPSNAHAASPANDCPSVPVRWLALWRFRVVLAIAAFALAGCTANQAINPSG